MKVRDGPGTLFVPEARCARDYFNTGLYERGYIDWAVENFAKPDKNILDIGAHIGMYTCAFGKKVKHVYSFECSPKSYNFLCANLLLRDLSYDVTKFNCALSDKEGTTKYYIRDPRDGGGNGISGFPNDAGVPTIDVPMRTLDSFGLTDINFIKMDVEGHEEFILRGALKTLEANSYPKILFESWPERYEERGLPAKDIRKSLFAFLESLNYKIMQIHGGTDDMFLAEHR